MNRSKFTLSMLSFGFLTLACAPRSSGPAFQSNAPPAGKGTVHFFRPNKFSGKGATIFLAVGDQVVNIKNLTYYTATLDPGAHEAIGVIYGRQAPIRFDVAAGAETYVRLEAVTAGISLAPQATVVGRDAAMPEISGCQMAASKVATK